MPLIRIPKRDAINARLLPTGGTTGQVPKRQSNGSVAWEDETGGVGGAPSGPAGGVLSGTYPNPGFAADMATQAELDAHVNDTSDAHDASAISYAGSTNLVATDVEAALDELDSEKSANGHTHTNIPLNDLSDVVLTSPSTGQVVKFDGTNWTNQADATGGGGGGTLNVERNDSLIVSGASAIDFSTAFTAAESPTGEANIGANFGSSAGTIAEGNDSRLSDQRVPTDDSVTNAKVAAGAAIAESKLALASDAAAGTASRRTLGTGALQAAAGNDARLSDARTPTSHASSHQPGGSDAMAVDAAAATGSLRTIGTGALQATAGNDSRLSDTRTPTDSSVTNAKVAAAAAIDESKLNLASDAAAGTASRRTLGTGALQAAAGNDSRLSDARTPTAHASSHSSGNSDPITHNNLAGLTTGDPHTQYAKKAGDTFSGALVLAGDAAAALNPISLQQWQTRAWKDPVTAATTAALPTNTRTGNVLTASANGALAAQDGITLGVNDSLWVKNEATGANNGLYTVTNAGGAGAAWVLTRRTDADTSAKIASGLIVEIQQGTTLGGKVWRMTNTTAPTLNTTALTFGAVPVDHADLTGLTTGDPHTQYALTDGTRLRGYRGTSAPSSPSAGQIWFDTNTTPPTLKEYDGSAWQVGLPRYHIIPFSYKGTLAITTGVLRVRIPTVVGACTVVEIGATVNTVSSSGGIILDVNKALTASLGTVTTLYTTQGNRPTIPASTRDVVATLPDVTSFAAGDHLLVDIDSAGTGASDLVGYVVLRY